MTEQFDDALPMSSADVVLQGAFLWSRRCAITRDFKAQEINDWIAWRAKATDDQVRYAKALSATAKELTFLGGV